jgi:transcriptional regulator with XRE-family HTH domain
MEGTVKRNISPDERALWNILSANIKKYRGRKAWSQSALAEKIGRSTHFIANIEAGSTWISSLTLIELAKVFNVAPYELLKPDKTPEKTENSQEMADLFSKDLESALQTSFKQTVEKVRKGYFG